MALLKMELLDYWTAEKELELLGCDIAVVTIRPGALAGETWAWLDMPCATVK